MNKDQIFEFMKWASNVEEWNALRIKLREKLEKLYKGQQVTLTIDKIGKLTLPKHIAMISEYVDSSGLIKKIL